MSSPGRKRFRGQRTGQYGMRRRWWRYSGGIGCAGMGSGGVVADQHIAKCKMHIESIASGGEANSRARPVNLQFAFCNSQIEMSYVDRPLDLPLANPKP